MRQAETQQAQEVPEKTQQVNKPATDAEKTAASSQGLGRDLERLTMNQKVCEKCLAGKQNSARQSRTF